MKILLLLIVVIPILLIFIAGVSIVRFISSIFYRANGNGYNSHTGQESRSSFGGNSKSYGAKQSSRSSNATRREESLNNIADNEGAYVDFEEIK